MKLIEEKYMKLMNELLDKGDPEVSHWKADELLCALLKDLGYSEIVYTYNKIKKWYA